VVVTWFHDASTTLRRRANVAIRRSAGLSQGPPDFCDDPNEAYSVVDGVARVVHGDLPSMLIGGVGSLFFQMLHPYAMAGVAQHSRYQEDALGRLLSTANFINATTYGSKSSAEAAIARVLNVHRFVHGVADDGTPYDANDPHLLLWVQCAEISMFLRAYRRFGQRPLTDDDADRYVLEMAPLAHDLGLDDAPRTVEELNATLRSFRPELRLCADGQMARDFIIHGVIKTRLQRGVFHLMVLSSWRLLDPWAQELLDVHPSALLDHAVIRPATRAMCFFMRLAVPPVRRQVAIVSPPSTTTT